MPPHTNPTPDLLFYQTIGILDFMIGSSRTCRLPTKFIRAVGPGPELVATPAPEEPSPPRPDAVDAAPAAASTDAPATGRGRRRDAAKGTHRDDWYLVVHGSARGPMSLAMVVTLAQLGAADRDTYAWREGLEEWFPLRCFPDLGRFLGPTRPRTAPIVCTPRLRRTGSRKWLMDRKAA